MASAAPQIDRFPGGAVARNAPGGAELLQAVGPFLPLPTYLAGRLAVRHASFRELLVRTLPRGGLEYLQLALADAAPGRRRLAAALAHGGWALARHLNADAIWVYEPGAT